MAERTRWWYVAPGFSPARVVQAVADSGLRAPEDHDEIRTRKRKGWRVMAVRIQASTVTGSRVRS